MSVDFSKVRLLRNEKIKPGERWIYVADFNVKPSLREEKYRRVDSELEDMLYILNKGASIVILAHRGRFGDSAEDMDLSFLAPYLKQKLNREIKYCEENVGEEARDFVDSLRQGEVALMGNTRQYEGEEKDDEKLAEEFAELVGKRGKVAIGGFGKAHRANASNVGILNFLPGYLTRSQVREMSQLGFWAGRQETLSVAVLGGAKEEKITDGLVGFAKTYNHIITGGIVLNALLKGQNYGVGASIVPDEETERKAVDALKKSNASIHFIPSNLLIAEKTEQGYRNIRAHDLRKGDVPEDYMIISYFMSEDAIEALEKVVAQEGRLVLAGTPDLYKEGFGLATNEVLERLKRLGRGALILGEDTSSEIKYDKAYGGTVSTGGGSALYFLANGTTPIFEKLKENKEKFP